MTLTLVIPGLLWPRQVMRDALFDADLPALQTLLGKGRRMANGATSSEAWWSMYFGIPQDKFAAAPLRLSAFGESPGDDHWLCADPVHLRINQNGAILTDPALLNISAAEARQLHALLVSMFAGIGDLQVTTPSHWHLRLARNVPALPARLNDLIEQSALALLPPGDEGWEWRQLINEAQMVLHAHPLNALRATQGKAEINSIALWGEGNAPSLRVRDSAALLSSDPIIAGAGKLAGMQASALPPRFSTALGDCIVYWDSLRFPSARRDALSWRDGLQQLEQDWLQPALAILGGDLKRIELHGFGDDRAISLSMTASDRYCFWRKPRRLESL